MTWYAHELFMKATPDARKVVQEDPLLSPFAYHLQGPIKYPWHRRDIIHIFPETGLFVVRPVCDPDSHSASWYDEPILNWHIPQASTTSPLDPRLVGEECGVEVWDFPPASLLGYFQCLATRANNTVVYYGCSMWGGSIECEYAFVLGSNPIAIVSLQEADDQGGIRSTAVVKHNRKTISSDGVFPIAMAELDFLLPSTFFVPHTRSFPWEKYQLHYEPMQ